MSLTQQITKGSAVTSLPGKSSRRAGFSIVALAIAFCFSPAAQAQPSPAAAVSFKDHPGWVQAPGALIRPDCVHEIPNGAQVEENGDIILEGSLVAHYDACPEEPIRTRPLHGVVPQYADSPGTGNGWIEAVQEQVSLTSGDNIDKVLGTWTVPSDPSKNGGVIFLFNGLEPTTENTIIQPVLQYGVSAAGGGNYWAIASWLVNPTNAYFSTLVTVNPGDTIQGNTYIKSTSGGKLNWEIKAKDTTTGVNSNLGAWSSGLTWNWTFSGVLEAYNITSCKNLPATTSDVFKGNTVDHGYPSFKSVSPTWYGALYSYGGPSCSFSATVGSSGNTLKW
jgi:hypothetical protein